jgi:Protein of unknown function (DUF2752)
MLKHQPSERSGGLIFLAMPGIHSKRARRISMVYFAQRERGFAIRSILKNFPWEAVIWLGGLLAMAFYQPSGQNHFTLCPFKNLGLDFCPGCGLGQSISYFLHGDLLRSLSTHPMGIFAVFVLSFRIIHLTKHYTLNLWQE